MTTIRATPTAPSAAPEPGAWVRALGRTGTPWGTLLGCAALMAYADGFVRQTVQGAVGAIELTGGPFATWQRISTLSLPVFLIAVLVAFVAAVRRFGPALDTVRAVLPAVLLVAAAGSLVGTAEVVGSTAYDYHLQSKQLAATAAVHHQRHAHEGGHSGEIAEEETLRADMVAAREAGAVLLVVNVAIVSWVAAMRGGRLGVHVIPRPIRADGGRPGHP